MAAPDWQIFVRDATYALVGELDEWLHAELTLRRNEVGTWRLETANAGAGAALLNRTVGIVVRYKGTTVLSGWVDEFTTTANTITASGRDDMALLADHVALPTPASFGPYPDEYNVWTGQASQMFINLVYVNIGAGARAGRAISALDFAPNPSLGSSITLRGRFQPLLAILREAALTPYAGGLGFSLQQGDADDTPGRIVFKVFAPEDRSADIKFSTEIGTAVDYSDTWQAPGANYVYVMLGDGLGAGRTILEDYDSDAITAAHRIIESVVDSRDVTDTSEGQQRLAEALATAAASQRVTIAPMEPGPLRYIEHYGLGDLVTFAAGGVSRTGVIQEISVQIDGERGAVVVPLVGDPGSSNDDTLATYVRSVVGRLSSIERNWNVPDDSITLAMMTHGAVAPVTLYAVDNPSNNEVPAYDTATGRFKWLSFNELVPPTVNLTHLNVAGNTVLGDNAAVDSVTVNAIMVANGAAALRNNVTIQNSVLTTLALFDVTAGAQKVSLGSVFSPGLYVDVANGRTIIGSTTPAASPAPDDRFTVFGMSYFVGNSGLSLDLRYNSSQSVGWKLGASVAGAHPALWMADAAGVVQVAVKDNSASYQVEIPGNLYIFGSAIAAVAFSTPILIIDGTTRVGSEKLRVVSGSSRFEGQVVVTTGGVDVSGASLFRSAVSFTAGGVDIHGGLDVDGGLIGHSGDFDWQVGGVSRIKADATGLSLFGATPIARPTVVGAKGGNVALANLMTALDALGAVTDLTT